MSHFVALADQLGHWCANWESPEFLVDFFPQRFALAPVFISIVLLSTLLSSTAPSHLAFWRLR